MPPEVPQFQEPQQLTATEDPDGLAEVAVFGSSDTGSAGARARLPEQYAADLFPMVVVSALVAGPVLVLGYVDDSMPWWATLTLALLIDTAVCAVYATHRFLWVPPPSG